ncbi:hypothetical protein SCNU_00205 [Gordonia neofelifaecis NRRL B-59395]|uniref:Uncharacterized protein n=1 Tax=Gordonia neofelifaecis NRRL B-59395 TaxID=644548 RepID=F1YEC0_9ACTN|nr:hypothetical protein SCNU_00205 [Gordonia neofelifaecis NRRL B-59395]
MTYDGSFSLTDEVMAILSPVAERVARLRNPAVMLGDIDVLVAETAATLDQIAEIVAKREAAQRVAHLRSIEQRSTALGALLRTRPRIGAPAVTAGMLPSCEWMMLLSPTSDALEGPLSDLLGLPAPRVESGSPVTGRVDEGRRSRAVEDAFRGLDAAATAVTARLDRLEASEARIASRRLPRRATANSVLRDLGVASWAEQPSITTANRNSSVGGKP